MNFAPLVLFVSIIVSYLYAFRQIYQLQVTEYRLDRFFTMLRDSGFSNLILPKLVFPAKSIRNVMIAILSLFLLVAINYLIYVYFEQNLVAILVFAFLNYFIAKDLVFLSSFFILPFANFFRLQNIKKAKKILEKSDVQCIGVTGSFGKSSVKEFIYQILSEKYKVERTSGNRNTDIGVALEIQDKINSDLDFFICEMGAYKIGEIDKICSFVKPKYGVLTGIGNQHMDLFGTQENLVWAKSELLRALPVNGVAIINIDNDYAQKLLQDVKAKTVTYGWSQEADYRILDIRYRNRLMFVNFCISDKEYKFTTALLGQHQAVNLLSVIALALELKISYEVIENAVAKIEPLESKLSVHTGFKGVTILNDGYNSNLDGFLSALEVSKNFDAKKKYAFSYGIFELGKERADAYKQVVASAIDAGVTLLTLDKRFMKFDDKSVIHMESEEEVMNFLRKNIDKEDFFLLEGRCTQEFLNFLNMKKYEVQDKKD